MSAGFNLIADGALQRQAVPTSKLGGRKHLRYLGLPVDKLLLQSLAIENLLPVFLNS